MFGRSKKATPVQVDPTVQHGPVDPLADIRKSRMERLWPVMACGSGLFSDGYINNVSGDLVLVCTM